MIQKIKKQGWLHLFLLLMALPGQAQTLDDYLKIASQNNPGVKAAYLEFEAALQRLPQVSALPDPTLSMSALGQMIETRVGTQEARFSLMQTFPWFGTLKAQKEVAALEAEALFQVFLDKRNRLFWEVKSGYYSLHEINHHLKHKQSDREILESLKVFALSRFENGAAPMTDVIRVDLLRNDTDTDIEVLKRKLRPLEITFNRLLNRSDSLPVVVQDSIPMPDVAITLQGKNLVASPRVEQYNKRVLAAQAREKVAYKNGLPKFGIGIDYSIISERTDADFSDNGQDAIMPVVSLSLPVFRKKYKAERKEAALLFQAYGEAKKAVENQLETEWQQAAFELDKAQMELRLFQKQMEDTQLTFKLLTTAYGNGQADADELLAIEQQLIRYRMESTTAHTKYLKAYAALEYLNAKNE